MSTVLVEDDTADAVKFAVCASALAFKGDVWWVNGLSDLNALLFKNGPPERLIIDNNLGDGSGIEWLNRSFKEGSLPPQTIVAALSSTNVSLVLKSYRGLNSFGVGAFPKPHIAELVLWMALREKENKEGANDYWNQHHLYDVEKSDTTFLTPFGRRFDRVFFNIQNLGRLHPSVLKNWLFQSGSLVVPETETFGLLQHMVSKEGLSAEQILGMKIDGFLERVRLIQGEGYSSPQTRK